MDTICSMIHSLSSSSEHTEDESQEELHEYLTQQCKNIQREAENSVEAVLSTLSDYLHSLAVCHLLAAWLSVKPPDQEDRIFERGCSFLMDCNSLHIRRCPTEFIYVCHALFNLAAAQSDNEVSHNEGGKCLEYSTRVSRLMMPMKNAVRVLRQKPSDITSVHSTYLKLCLVGKYYSHATRLLDVPILSIDRAYCQSSQDYLSYFYYGALVYAGMKQFAKAHKFLSIVLTAPATDVSLIQIDAWKKYYFVSILLDGKVAEFQPFMSNEVIAAILWECGSPFYREFTDAVKRKDTNEMSNIICKYKDDLLKKEHNYGLAKQTLRAVLRSKVRRLSNVYSRMSINEISAALGSKDNWETTTTLLSMAVDGEICVKMDELRGIVKFDSFFKKTNNLEAEEELIDRMEKSSNRVAFLSDTLAQAELQLLSSEAYAARFHSLQRQVLAGERLGGNTIGRRDSDEMRMPEDDKYLSAYMRFNNADRGGVDLHSDDSDAMETRERNK